MEPTSSFDVVSHAVNKFFVFASRPQIQVQVMVILFCIAVAALFTAFLSNRTVTSIDRWIDGHKSRLRRRVEHSLFRYVQAASFPLYSILLVESARRIMERQGYITGLMGHFDWVLTTLLAFQLLITTLYILFDEDEIYRFHYRLLLPLLVVVVFLEMINDLVSLQEISQVELFYIFDRPVTLGALSIATIGLYFWTDAVHGLQELTYKFVVRRTKADPGSTKATLTLVRYMLIIAGVFYAFSQLRFDSTTIAAITGGLSVGIGFGLREILSNFVSGLLLLFERSLHPGDVIEVDDQLSTVENFSIRATTVRTLNNVELVIPNQTFFTSSFKTYTGSDHTVRVPLIIRTDCVIEPRAVIDLLTQTALQHEDVLADPAPSVFILDYADNVATFQLNIWLGNPILSPRVTSEVRLLVWDAFGANNIALPFPETEIHFSNQKPLQMESMFTLEEAMNLKSAAAAAD